eukprot:762539-Hanusia_phi.AAC.2
MPLALKVDEDLPNCALCGERCTHDDLALGPVELGNTAGWFDLSPSKRQIRNQSRRAKLESSEKKIFKARANVMESLASVKGLFLKLYRYSADNKIQEAPRLPDYPKNGTDEQHQEAISKLGGKIEARLNELAEMFKGETVYVRKGGEMQLLDDKDARQQAGKIIKILAEVLRPDLPVTTHLISFWQMFINYAELKRQVYRTKLARKKFDKRVAVHQGRKQEVRQHNINMRE